MYAIIRSGGKQAKVREGDIVDVERLHAEGEVTFTPLLLVDDKGTVVSNRDVLKSAKVTARVVGESSGDKIDIFKYKAKTGYRNRGGHRQRYTTIEVLKIEGPKKAAAAKTPEGDATAADKPAPKQKATTAKPAGGTAVAKKAAPKKAASDAATQPAEGTDEGS